MSAEALVLNGAPRKIRTPDLLIRSYKYRPSQIITKYTFKPCDKGILLLFFIT